MADESIEKLFTPELTKPDKGNSRRNSTGIVKNNSTGRSSSPNYLRASTGSCHNFCKYGREHAFAVKARNPIPKRTPPSDKKNYLESEVVAGKTKTSAVKLKPSPDLKIQSPGQNMGNVVPAGRKKTSVAKLKPSHDLNHFPEPPEIIKHEILLPSKKVEVYSKKNIPNSKKMKDNEMMMTSSSKRSPALKLKPVMARPSSFSTASVGLYGTRKTIAKPECIAGRTKTAVKKVLIPPTASLSPKPSGSRLVSLYARKYSSLKVASPLKDQYGKQKPESEKLDSDKVQEKTLYVVEAETEKKILESIQSDDIMQISPSSTPSPFFQSPLSLSHPDSQFLSSYGDDVEYTGREDLELFGYTGRDDLENPEYTDTEDLEESEYTASEADEFGSENDEAVNINEVDTSKGNHKPSPRKGRVITSVDKESALAKSKFRRGKIVDLQSENNVPRKLKFRRGRVVGNNDDRKATARRRSFKEREVGDDANGASRDSEKVVLRHQDMQGKKDAQGLFNNVIEETASKLVESRKSKVKALVGAFETVISLQESKTSTQTGT